MLPEQANLVREEISTGTGANIDISVISSGVQTGLKIWFADLSRSRGPVIDLTPFGLTRYRVELYFGSFSADTILQMQGAGEEELALARSLMQCVSNTPNVHLSGSAAGDNWVITGESFRVMAEMKRVENRFSNEALISVCRELVIPMMGAMAELCGYEEVKDLSSPDSMEGEKEGALHIATVRRRERNPRNRLLCLRVHGNLCGVCQLDPAMRYGTRGGILEVHHLQPLSLADQSRTYNPLTDLIPLCPNCHRAVHTRRPVPWTPADIRAEMEMTNG